jgi:Leucine-rich repeat (LRR) protein
LDLSDCSISNIYALKDLKNLQHLDLTNNCIYDSASFTDSDNNVITYNTMELLANLNSVKNGALMYLYLSGNSGIIDYSPVSSLKWSGKSGF